VSPASGDLRAPGGVPLRARRDRVCPTAVTCDTTKTSPAWPWRPLILDALSDPEAAATLADLEGVIVLVERRLSQVGAARRYGRELCRRQAGP
jgi:hypothetical protein